MANVRFDGAAPTITGRGRPIGLVSARHAVESAIGSPAETAAIRRWMADPLFSAPLGRVPGDPGETVVRAYVERFDRILNHLFLLRDAERREIGMATVGIDPQNRIAWLEIMIGERGRRDTQIVLSDVGRELTRWIFEDLGLAKMSVQCAASNTRTAAWLSSRLALEATLRDELLLHNGRRETLLRFAVLASEWDGMRRAYETRDAAGVAPITPRRPRADATRTYRAGPDDQLGPETGPGAE